MQASVCSGEFPDVRPVEHAGDAAVDRAERADQVGRIDVVRAPSWRRTCAARRCGSPRASRPAARCAGSPATCAGGCRRSPASRCGFCASITCAFGALMFGRTAEIFLPSISTSACSKSPTARSSDSTQPPLMQDRPAGLRGRLSLGIGGRADHACGDRGGRDRACRRGAEKLAPRQLPGAADSTGNRN